MCQFVPVAALRTHAVPAPPVDAAIAKTALDRHTAAAEAMAGPLAALTDALRQVETPTERILPERPGVSRWVRGHTSEPARAARCVWPVIMRSERPVADLAQSVPEDRPPQGPRSESTAYSPVSHKAALGLLVALALLLVQAMLGRP